MARKADGGQLKGEGKLTDKLLHQNATRILGLADAVANAERAAAALHTAS